MCSAVKSQLIAFDTIVGLGIGASVGGIGMGQMQFPVNQ